MLNNKIFSYIGFAIKKNSVIYGLDSIELYRKKMYLILMCHSMAENSTSKALQISNRLEIPILRTTNTLLEEWVNKRNCKLIAIRDKQLADVILKNIAEDTFIIFGGSIIDNE